MAEAYESILVENVKFDSDGHQLLGRVYRPNAEGRFPAVAICHGYPGDTKNNDLAEELAVNGIVALIFFYRGAWGSGGKYSFDGLTPSTRDAISYLKSLPQVDPSRVGLVGFSLGAVPLVAALSSDPLLKTGVFVSPGSDLAALAPKEALDIVMGVFIKMAEGKLSGLDADTMKEGFNWVLENGNPVDLIGDVSVPVMVVVGSNDKLTPPDVCRKLYEAANEPKSWVLIEGADHIYSEHRYPLMAAVLDWLRKNL